MVITLTPCTKNSDLAKRNTYSLEQLQRDEEGGGQGSQQNE